MGITNLAQVRRGWSGYYFALLLDVIHQNVLAEPLGGRVERSSLIDLRHLLNEAHQHVTTLEHERIDGDLVSSTPGNFPKGLLNRAIGRRVGELRVGLTGLKVGCGLSICDHDDLPIAALVPRKKLTGQHESMLHVRTVDPLVPGERGERFGLELLGKQREANDVQIVARILALDETV